AFQNRTVAFAALIAQTQALDRRGRERFHSMGEKMQLMDNLSLRFALSVSAAIMAASITATSPARPIAVTPLVREGDVVAGVGTVTSINAISVNNTGHWLVEADTDAAANDVAVLRDGVVIHREGDRVPPPPALIGSFDSVRLNSAQNIGWNLFLSGMTTSTDSGVYFNTTLLIPESAISTAPQLSPNTPYIGWFEVRMNDSNQLMMVASVDDPAIASTVDRALVLVNYNSGNNTFTE